MAKPKFLLFALVAVSGGLLSLELALDLAFYVRDSRSQFEPQKPFVKIAQPNSELGWIMSPAQRHEDCYGKGRHLTINAQGFRTSHESDSVAEGGYRVICLGDSFTLGHGVNDDASYPALLESVNPSVQTINMGVAGYSVGQCWLWYKHERPNLHPNLVILALIEADVSRLRYGIQNYQASTPRFRLKNGMIDVYFPSDFELRKQSAPKPSLWESFRKRSGIARVLSKFLRLTLSPQPSTLSAEEFGELIWVSEAIIHDLQLRVRESGSDFAVVLLPAPQNLSEEGPGRNYLMLSAGLEDMALKFGFLFRDLRQDYSHLPYAEAMKLFNPADSHGNERGNGLIAESINGWLTKMLPNYAKAPD